MIWLFKVNDVYWDNKPKVNEFYTFDVDDIHFDITKYDVSLYFGTASYYLLNESNEDELYGLQFEHIHKNPIRVLIPNSSEIYGIIKEFYKKNKNQTSLSNALEWYNNLPKEKRNNLIKEKRPARTGYVDKGMINLTNKEIIELYRLHVV